MTQEHLLTRFTFAAMLALTATAALPTSSEAASAPGLVIAVEGAERTIFDYSKSACAVWDVPDTPTRAYRDADGTIHAFQTHFENRALKGKDFASLKRDCKIVFKGTENDNPAAFDDRGWVGSTYTPDGKTVYAIVHDEFQGNRRPQLCPSLVYLKCWYNTLTAVVSEDGGETFKPQSPRLVAAVPFRASETQGSQAGYFEPTNIISNRGFLFFMANVVSPAPQLPGNWLVRTATPDKPASWRLWRSGHYSTMLVDPYRYSNLKFADHLCDPIDPSALPWPVKSLVKHEPSGLFIATMIGRQTINGTMTYGFFYSTSSDLIDWDGPALLMPAQTDKTSCAASSVSAYPTIIDPNSTSRNFDTIGDVGELTFVRVALKDCATTTTRDILSVSVRIKVPAKTATTTASAK